MCIPNQNQWIHEQQHHGLEHDLQVEDGVAKIGRKRSGYVAQDVTEGHRQAVDGRPAHAAENLVHEGPSVVGLESLVPDDAKEENDVHDCNEDADNDADHFGGVVGEEEVVHVFVVVGHLGWVLIRK